MVTAAVADAIARIPHRYLRTTRHPGATVLEGAPSFDAVYERADTFDDVYREITDQLVAAATTHGEILYAVPGSPLVLERTVRYLRDDPRVETELLPSLSFLDLAYDRLGIDPIEARLRLIDGHEFATAAAGEAGPMLVSHCHANWVLSDIKLAVEGARGDEPVVILQRLGGPDERIVHTTWAELDRTVEADHLTCIYIPHLPEPVGAPLVRFHEVVRRLRAECPWDREQTHQSLARYAIEETYELVEAIGGLGPEGEGDAELEEELGDVLLQVVLHAAIAEQAGRFNLGDVATTITAKMVRRHPHVFGDVEVAGAADVIANWADIKAAEKGGEPSSSLDGVPGELPALEYARELGSRAAKAGIDWDDPRGTLDKVREEVAEVDEVFDDPKLVGAEIGDLLFAVANLARHRHVDPEVALRQSAAKFRRRVRGLEELAAERGIDTRSCGLAVLDELWNEVKATEH
jgi:tetrapyrrole methylase family protein/MazG family protein